MNKLDVFLMVFVTFVLDQAVQLTEGLLIRGLDLGSRDDFPKGNPLHVAAQRNFFYVAQLLLDADAPTDTKSEDGKLAVELAIEERSDDVAALIMKRMGKER